MCENVGATGEFARSNFLYRGVAKGPGALPPSRDAIAFANREESTYLIFKKIDLITQQRVEWSPPHLSISKQNVPGLRKGLRTADLVIAGD
jgi:hypothetical protein